MTANQVAYAQLKEQQRANKTKEQETERSNRANEEIQHTGNVLKYRTEQAKNFTNAKGISGKISALGSSLVSDLSLTGKKYNLYS